MSEDTSTPNAAPDDDAWPVSFEAHRLAQMRRMAALSLEEKVDWLEAAQRVVLALQAERERAKLQAGDPDHDN